MIKGCLSRAVVSVLMITRISEVYKRIKTNNRERRKIKELVDSGNPMNSLTAVLFALRSPETGIP